MDTRQLTKEAKYRVSHLAFGQPVTNVCAGNDNPQKHGYFVRVIGDCVEVTDKYGKFWTVGDRVIFPGHLDYEEMKRAFAPIHAALYGS